MKQTLPLLATRARLRAERSAALGEIDARLEQSLAERLHAHTALRAALPARYTGAELAAQQAALDALLARACARLRDSAEAGHTRVFLRFAPHLRRRTRMHSRPERFFPTSLF